MDARSILGVPEVRPPLLVDVPPAEKRQTETCGRHAGLLIFMTRLLRYRLDDDDDPDDDLEDEDEFDEDEDADDEDDEEGDEDEPETWQVGRSPSSFPTSR